jgi:RNA polymerase sigma-70 factor (ECF subfamily)
VPNSELLPLLQRCLDSGGERSWESFIHAAQPLLVSGVVRALGGWSAAKREQIDDLVQESFVRLCANDFRALRSFRSEDAYAFCAYLRTVAASVATDHLRSASAQKHAAGERAVSLQALTREPASGDDAIAAIERNMLLELIARCLESQTKRDRTIFWLYHRQGLTPKAISALETFALAQRGVETILYRVTGAVRDCVRNFQSQKKSAFTEGAGT